MSVARNLKHYFCKIMKKCFTMSLCEITRLSYYISVEFDHCQKWGETRLLNIGFSIWSKFQALPLQNNEEVLCYVSQHLEPSLTKFVAWVYHLHKL